MTNSRCHQRIAEIKRLLSNDNSDKKTDTEENDQKIICSECKKGVLVPFINTGVGFRDLLSPVFKTRFLFDTS